jgi:hypothetical protein
LLCPDGYAAVAAEVKQAWGGVCVPNAAKDHLNSVNQKLVKGRSLSGFCHDLLGGSSDLAGLLPRSTKPFVSRTMSFPGAPPCSNLYVGRTVSLSNGRDSEPSLIKRDEPHPPSSKCWSLEILRRLSTLSICSSSPN